MNYAERLAKRVASAVYSKQVTLVHTLKGKHVERNGVTFLVIKVDWRGGKITVSDTKASVETATEMITYVVNNHPGGIDRIMVNSDVIGYNPMEYQKFASLGDGLPPQAYPVLGANALAFLKPNKYS